MSPSLNQANFFSYNPFVRVVFVASVSNRVIARKLEREPKKNGMGGEKASVSFSPFPLPRHSSFLLSSQLSRKLARKRLVRRPLFAQPGQLGQSETVKASWLFDNFSPAYKHFSLERKPLTNQWKMIILVGYSLVLLPNWKNLFTKKSNQVLICTYNSLESIQ